jgi:hypothetical protein
MEFIPESVFNVQRKNCVASDDAPEFVVQYPAVVALGREELCCVRARPHWP